MRAWECERKIQHYVSEFKDGGMCLDGRWANTLLLKKFFCPLFFRRNAETKLSMRENEETLAQKFRLFQGTSATLTTITTTVPPILQRAFPLRYCPHYLIFPFRTEYKPFFQQMTDETLLSKRYMVSLFLVCLVSSFLDFFFSSLAQNVVWDETKYKVKDRKYRFTFLIIQVSSSKLKFRQWWEAIHIGNKLL